MWDKRRVLPRYAQHFCELLAAHMRELFPNRAAAGSRAGRFANRARAT